MKYLGILILIAISLVVGYHIRDMQTYDHINDTVLFTVTEYTPTPDTVYTLEIRDSIIYVDSLIYIIEYKDSIVEVPVAASTAGKLHDYFLFKSYKIDTAVNSIQVIGNFDLYANRLLGYSISATLLEAPTIPVTISPWGVGGIIGYHEVDAITTFTHKHYTFIAGVNTYGLVDGQSIAQSLRLGLLYRF